MDTRTAQDRTARVPAYSRNHPVIPRFYNQEWKNDMPNRKLIIDNADQGGVPAFEKDDNLFLEKREQMTYNVEERSRVENKYQLPPREQMVRPPLHSHHSRYRSSLMSRKESMTYSK